LAWTLVATLLAANLVHAVLTRRDFFLFPPLFDVLIAIALVVALLK
jgi:hypothetical protein